MSIDQEVDQDRFDAWRAENEAELVYMFAHEQYTLFMEWLECLTGREFQQYSEYGVKGLYSAFADRYDKVYEIFVEREYADGLPDAPETKESEV